jgi:hypothetical protein
MKFVEPCRAHDGFTNVQQAPVRPSDRDHTAPNLLPTEGPTRVDWSEIADRVPLLASLSQITRDTSRVRVLTAGAVVFRRSAKPDTHVSPGR